MYLERRLESELVDLSSSYPVVTVTGPRQSGKTTLIRHCFPDKPYFSLEDPDLRQLVNQDPRGFLNQFKDGVLLDEIQNTPQLPSYIQGIVDESQKSGQFILSGSQQFELLHSITQSLAGRSALLTLLPFSLAEVHLYPQQYTLDQLLLTGFYPRLYVQKQSPTKAHRNYYKTYIERDLRKLINIRDIRLFEKFVRLCAGRIGNVFVASNLANEVGVSSKTIQAWLSLLEASYIVCLLQPYYANIGKRLIKSPKLYFYDVGLASYLLGIQTEAQLSRDPLRGALFENMVVIECMKARLNQGLEHNLYYYLDQHKNEVDLIYTYGNQLLPIEIKSATTYHKEFTKGLTYVKRLFGDNIHRGYVIYAGDYQQEIDWICLTNYNSAGKIFAD